MRSPICMRVDFISGLNIFLNFVSKIMSSRIKSNCRQ